MANMALFKELVGEVQDLNSTQGLLGWDLETTMPHKGSDIRAKQMATLSKISHEKLTSQQMGNLLTQLRQSEVNAQLSQVDRAMVREVGRAYDQAVKLPVSLVQEMTETQTKAHHAWVEARQNNDFKRFAPLLKTLVQQNLQMADYYGYEESPYNALLDIYEPDLTTHKVDLLFNQLRPGLVQLVQAIVGSGVQPQTSFLKRVSSEEKQWAFSVDVIQRMGFDLDAGRLDKAPHPFCMGMGAGDVRLTTRVFKKDLLSCLFSTMHEAGHGLYEQGSDPSLFRTMLDGGASLGIHESQSRLWENIVGRSKPFWTYFLPKLRKAFPRQLKGVRLETFYKAINRVEPSFIRVESDEVTYNLHIMLRYEIEKDLLEGRLTVEDIPERWNTAMQEYLGVTPPTDSLGCLQDVHWSHGSFGYFPTYTIGNVFSVQVFQAAKQQIKGLENEIAKGRLLTLKTWLNQQIHHCSKVETPEQIIQRVAGGPLDAQVFLDYLWSKYSAIYPINPE